MGVTVNQFDKWIDWVWIPFIGGAVAFAIWVLGRFEQVRVDREASATTLRGELSKEVIELHERITKAEERQLKAADAMERYIDVLHKKTNAVRDEIKDYKTEAERHFATKNEVDREAARLRELLPLTRPVP
jgi:hypothetical protein